MQETIIHRHMDGNGTLTFETVQDCTGSAERAQRMHNEGVHGSSDMKLAATIPNVFIDDYCNRNNITFHEFIKNREHIKAILNDPALAYFRIWKGKV